MVYRLFHSLRYVQETRQINYIPNAWWLTLKITLMQVIFNSADRWILG